MSEEEKKEPAPSVPAVVMQGQFRPLTTIEPTPLNPKGITTNFPYQGVDAARFITQAIAKDGMRLDEVDTEVFMCKYYLAHVAEFVSEVGEIIPMPRCLLIGPNGETMQFVSQGAMDSFDLIRSLCGDGPWDPPLPISVVPVRTRRGFRTYRLALGEDRTNGQQSPMDGGRNEPSPQASDTEIPKKKRG